MSDRTVIDAADLVVKHKGVTYTGAAFIEQASSWVCPVTGLSFRKFLRFEKCDKSRRYMVCALPSGHEYSTEVGKWLKGIRPSATTLDNCIIKKESESYGKFIKFSKTKSGMPTMQLLLASGEIHECRIANWRKGKRPTQFAMNKHLYIQQAEDYGYRFLEWGKQGTQPTMKLLLPDGSIYECTVGSWVKGSRPDTLVGRYSETFFERNPQAGESSALIYYLKISHPTLPTFYKIGITTKDCTTHRWGKRDGDYEIQVLNEHSMSLYNCFRLEQDLIKTFAEYRFSPDPPLKGNGNTECFSIDLLELDPEIAYGDELLPLAA